MLVNTEYEMKIPARLFGSYNVIQKISTLKHQTK